MEKLRAVRRDASFAMRLFVAVPASKDHCPQYQNLSPALPCVRTWPRVKLSPTWSSPVASGEGPGVGVVGRPRLSLTPLTHAPTDRELAVSSRRRKLL